MTGDRQPAFIAPSMASPNLLWSSEILYDRCLHLTTLLLHCQIADRSAKFCWAPRRPQSHKARRETRSALTLWARPRRPPRPCRTPATALSAIQCTSHVWLSRDHDSTPSGHHRTRARLASPLPLSSDARRASWCSTFNFYRGLVRDALCFPTRLKRVPLIGLLENEGFSHSAKHAAPFRQTRRL
jgi:hypothetical protein